MDSMMATSTMATSASMATTFMTTAALMATSSMATAKLMATSPTSPSYWTMKEVVAMSAEVVVFFPFVMVVKIRPIAPIAPSIGRVPV
jgi:hypothetical protein